MSSYQRILLLASASMQRTPAFERAAWLARTTGASLQISIVDYDRSSHDKPVTNPFGTNLSNRFVEEVHLWLANEVEQLLDAHVEASAQAVWVPSVIDEIMEQVDELRPDIVIKDADTATLRRFQRSPLDVQLLRECPVPLMLVDRASQAAPQRVLAAVDFEREPNQHDALSIEVLDQANTLARQCSATLDVAHTRSSRPAAPGRDLNEDDAHANLQAPQSHLLTGPALDALAEAVQQLHSDIVVMGFRRDGSEPSGVDPMPERLLDKAGCDVLAIRYPHRPTTIATLSPQTATVH